VGRGIDRKTRRRAARIERAARRIAAQAKVIIIGLDAEDQIADLQIVSRLDAAGESPRRSQALIADTVDRWNAAGREIASRIENRAGRVVEMSRRAAESAAAVKTVPAYSQAIAGLQRAGAAPDQRQTRQRLPKSKTERQRAAFSSIDP
jgi:hypothetical protein